MSDETTRVERSAPSSANSNAVARADAGKRVAARRRRERRRRQANVKRDVRRPQMEEDASDCEEGKRGSQLDLLA